MGSFPVAGLGSSLGPGLAPSPTKARDCAVTMFLYLALELKGFLGEILLLCLVPVLEVGQRENLGVCVKEVHAT